MNCSEVTLNLQLLVDQELTEDKICEIKEHLESCTGCVEKFEAEKLFKQILKDKICKRCPGTLVDDVRSSVLQHS